MESSTIASILPLLEAHKDKKILVVFDLDNTLVRGASYLSSVEFAYARKAKMIQQGMSPEDALNQMLNDFIYINHYEPLVLVEEKSRTTLKQLQEENINYIALTGRSMQLAQRTLDQLKQVTLTFNFSHKPFFMYQGYPVLYTEGIIFSSLYNKKEEVLRDFFVRTGYHPEMVIFVDDEEHYLQPMQTMLEKQDIAFEGIRISACDELVKKLPLEKTEQQFTAFKQRQGNR